VLLLSSEGMLSAIQGPETPVVNHWTIDVSAFGNAVVRVPRRPLAEETSPAPPPSTLLALRAPACEMDPALPRALARGADLALTHTRASRCSRAPSAYRSVLSRSVPPTRFTPATFALLRNIELRVDKPPFQLSNKQMLCLKACVANVCFKCFRCFRDILQK
jgi:hypothetical protein